MIAALPTLSPEVLIAALSVFVLSIFLGFELISKVPPTLHTPLMSGANAISGITIVGALVAANVAMEGGRRWSRASASSPLPWRPSTWSVASSSPAGCWPCSRRRSAEMDSITHLADLGYLVAAALFILGIKGLGCCGPRSAATSSGRPACSWPS